MGAWESGNFENDTAMDWLGDLRESGSIEQDSDVVIFTYNSKLKIGKNRNGKAPAIIPVYFNKSTTRFCNAERPAANAQRV